VDVRLVQFVFDDDGQDSASVFGARERIDEMAVDRREAEDEQSRRLPGS
jgi:hypothetical protein